MNTARPMLIAATVALWAIVIWQVVGLASGPSVDEFASLVPTSTADTVFVAPPVTTTTTIAVEVSSISSERCDLYRYTVGSECADALRTMDALGILDQWQYAPPCWEDEVLVLVVGEWHQDRHLLADVSLPLECVALSELTTGYRP